jgi:hypothetical protein
MKRTISLISVTLLSGALATLAFAQAPAAPTTDSPPTVQQEVVAHHREAMLAHRREALMAHRREALMAHRREAMMAHHNGMMEKGEPAPSNQAPPVNQPAPAN